MKELAPEEQTGRQKSGEIETERERGRAIKGESKRHRKDIGQKGK